MWISISTPFECRKMNDGASVNAILEQCTGRVRSHWKWNRRCKCQPTSSFASAYTVLHTRPTMDHIAAASWLVCFYAWNAVEINHLKYRFKSTLVGDDLKRIRWCAQCSPTNRTSNQLTECRLYTRLSACAMAALVSTFLFSREWKEALFSVQSVVCCNRNRTGLQ